MQGLKLPEINQPFFLMSLDLESDPLGCSSHYHVVLVFLLRPRSSGILVLDGQSSLHLSLILLVLVLDDDGGSIRSVSVLLISLSRSLLSLGPSSDSASGHVQIRRERCAKSRWEDTSVGSKRCVEDCELSWRELDAFLGGLEGGRSEEVDELAVGEDERCGGWLRGCMNVHISGSGRWLSSSLSFEW